MGGEEAQQGPALAGGEYGAPDKTCSVAKVGPPGKVSSSLANTRRMC